MDDRQDDTGPLLPGMGRRQFLVFGLGGAAAFTIGACSSDDETASGAGSGATSGTEPGAEPTDLEPAPRPTVRLPFGAFGFPSPFSSNGPPGYVQMSLLYDTLLWKDSTGEPLPWLAESFERSDDDLTFTFELRPDVLWSDGTPLTAEDVVFTFDFYAGLEGLPPPVVAQAPQGIASVTASGPTTVAITLESPDVTFPEQVAGTIPIIPRHIWEGITDPAAEQDVAILVGSGPYVLDSAFEGDGSPLLYVANDEYFLGTPFVERIEFTEIEDQFAALLGDAVDSGVGTGLRDDILGPFENDDRFGILTSQGQSTTGLYFNLTKGGALADAGFRRACAMAIDRQDLVDRLAGGNGRPGNPGFLGEENPFVADVEQYAFDVEGANTLLDDAGFARADGGGRQGPDGAPLSFELLVSNLETALGELVSAALGEIGVETTIRAAEPGPGIFGAKFSGQFDLVLLGFPGPSAGSLNGDPDLLRRVFSSEAPPSLTSAVGYANPAFDELAAEQRVTFDEDERATIVAEMQALIAEDVPIISLFSPDSTFVFRTDVLEEWYRTPGRYPIDIDNKQLFVTGLSTGVTIRPIE
ncbi:MAG: ABC transporter substrate-binding protein [Acidimicrobiales bacterium]